MTQEGPGAVIGRYKLLQKVGEGGFGVVYQAEQTEPVRRTVALKIIKLGMDTRQVIARFEAERQALALMEHPNIAKVLDAGATEGGRPYFVMELVKGVPITEYCDRARLDTAERLDLFRQVCHAVQHAHQKGIIHRDLKPSNVLVALHDGGVPVPKVIDFGIAKATGRHLTDKTLFTEFRQMIGTPEYMAPEQAEMSGLDIDTRADIYSLGVLLYELLTGTKPHDLETLAGKGHDEILRTIREVDPERPSARVSTMGGELEGVASKRRTARKGLGHALKGDLDWIVMKALEKDRSRRYDTANAMALDIERHLEDQPVSACPPGTVYRARKYVRRHRAGVAAASVALAMLVLGAVLSFAGYADASERRGRARASHEAAARDQAAAERARAGETEQRTLAEAREKDAETDAKRAKTVLGLVEDMLGSSDPEQVKGRDYTVRQLLDDFDRDLGTRLEGDPEVEAAVRTTMGIAYANLGLYDKAEPHLKKALELLRRSGTEDARLASSLNNWAMLQRERGAYDEAEKLLREALAIQRRTLGEEHPDMATSLSNLAMVLRAKARYDEAERLHREALAIQRKTLGEAHPAVARSLSNLALVLNAKGDYGEAERLQREALAIQRKTLGNAHPSVAASLNSLAMVLSAKGDFGEAERLQREALGIKRELLGDEHPDMALSFHNLAAVLAAKGKYDEAERLLREALAIQRKTFAEAHPDVAASLNSLAVVLARKGNYGEAEGLLREALAIRRKTLGEEHPDVATSLNNLAGVLARKGNYGEAEKLLREALAIRRKTLGEEHRDVAASLHDLGALLNNKGDFDGAERLLREALAIRRKTLGGEHPDVATSLHTLGLVLQAKGDLDGAETLHLEALAIRRKVLGDEHPDVAESLNDLLGPLVAQEDWLAAEPVCRELLARGRSHLPLAVLGVCLLKQAKWEEAEPILRACLALREKEMPDDWLRYSAMSMLGEAVWGQGKHAEAEPLLVEGYEKMAPPEYAAFRKGEALERVVKLYEAWGKPEKAAEWRARRDEAPAK